MTETVLLLGTLDTKGHEYAFARDRLRDLDVGVLLVDAGINEPVGVEPDVGRGAVAEAAGARVEDLASVGDRGAAVEAMARGAAVVVRRLFDEGRFDGILALGGSGGSSIATAAMRDLPVGVPKLMVSTMAAGDTRPYVGATDLTMMASVVDIAGVNSVSARIMTNAAGAIAGMVGARAPDLAHRKVIAATMFGVTTPCVTRARELLDELGYEVLVFHATGTGGQAMEVLASDGYLAGVLDITTTELADDLIGGVLSAGPDRLEAAGRSGIPQVVSLGALDMVNFGPRDTVPERFEQRRLYVHNPTVTLMRTTPEECAELGRRIGRKLSAARGPTVLFVPLRGVSMIDVEGQPFHDPAADRALIEGVRETLDGSVEVHELDTDINDERFATAMAHRLHELVTETI
ncbi:MAG: Tm-1-like ATP-binding domain-containing protein [Solirubrobacterales bacterium]|nr:Tm-1-like ATP-binding domain-containing protein [Solirubrobacterales bacterium]